MTARSLGKEWAYGGKHSYPAGFHMLFDKDFAPLDWANHFMLQQVNATRRSGLAWENTQSDYADDLAVFATFLEVRGIRFRDIEPVDLTDYASCMLHTISPQTRKKYSVKTVHRRLNTVVRCCECAFELGILKKSVITYTRQPTRRIIGGAKAVVATPDVISGLPTPEAADTHVAPIAKGNITKILDKLGPGPREGSLLDRRNRLIAEFGLETGMRISEILGLTLVQIYNLPSPDDLEEFGFARLTLTDTKYTKVGDVLLPKALLEEILVYISGERAKVIQEAKKNCEAHGKRFCEPKHIFLNGITSNERDLGKKCSAANISRIFTEAVRQAGLFRKESRYILDDNVSPVVGEDGRFEEDLVDVPAHTFHDLRHTFAVTLYRTRQLQGDKNPLATVKALLRHSLTETTERIYLRWLTVNEAELSDNLTTTLRKITAWYA